MASAHCVNLRARFGVIRFWGRVDGGQLIRETRSFFEDADVPLGLNVLWDARDVEMLELLPEDVERMTAVIQRFRSRLGPGRSAVVAEIPDVDIAARLLKAVAARDPERRVEIFDELDGALRWLGTDEDTARETIRNVHSGQQG